MKKWPCILIFLLILGVAFAEDTFYTNNEDRYYHSNPDCDRPTETDWTGIAREFYPREAYEKYEISEVAAAEFEKAPCTVCVLEFEPVYLGDYMPDWKWQTEPWRIRTDEAMKADIRKEMPAAYLNESADTHAAFEAFYEEVYDKKTDSFVRRNAYPAAFAGDYANISSTMTYAVVNPTQDVLEAFERNFGGGAWIVPAKYGWDEMYAEQDRIFNALVEWCQEHSEIGTMPSSAGIDVVENKLIVGISGLNWQQAAAAMEDAPPYVCFAYEELSFEAAKGK